MHLSWKKANALSYTCMKIIIVHPKTNGHRRQINTNRYCISDIRIINLDCTIHIQTYEKELEMKKTETVCIIGIHTAHICIPRAVFFYDTRCGVSKKKETETENYLLLSHLNLFGQCSNVISESAARKPDCKNEESHNCSGNVKSNAFRFLFRSL